ncbi:MAG TPA: HAD family hydrolase [Caulobacteraceae bacterium]|jgi:putative hydrolase of the HAD superfamily
MVRFPRAILFDLDETLLSFGDRIEQIRTVVDAGGAWVPLSNDQVVETIEAAFRAHWADAARHKIWRARPLIEARRSIALEGFAELRRLGGLDLTDERAVAFAEAFHACREGQIAPFPGALQTVDALRDRGVRLALVTNGQSTVQRAKIERFGLAHRFDHIQIEGEHGFGKPEERAYRHALETLGVDAPDAWMVGDNLEWEVVAPQKLGLHAIWFDPRGAGVPAGSSARPDRIIARLDELLV